MNDQGQKLSARFQRVSPAQFFLLTILLTALYFAFKIIQPYAGAIILAALIASVFQPVHRWILSRVKNRATIAAFLSSSLLIFLVLLPLVLMGIALVDQGISVSQGILRWVKSGEVEKILSDKKLEHLLERFQILIPQLDLDNINITDNLISTFSSIARFTFDQSGSIAANLTSKLMNFSMMVFVFFFFVRDGTGILDQILHMIPLSKSQEGQIMVRIKGIARSVFLGTMLTALAQGIAGGIGFAICGIPALFWGSLLAFASLIPVVGTAIIWIPAVIYLVISSQYGLAIFLTIYSVAVVGSIDNFLRPVFMKGAGEMSTFMIFLSIIGGMQYFGFSGILYGPLVFGLAWILLIIYEIEFRQYLNQQDNS